LAGANHSRSGFLRLNGDTPRNAIEFKLHGGFITHSFSAGLKTADLCASGEKALATELCKPSYERGCQEKSSPFLEVPPLLVGSVPAASANVGSVPITE
jgi:hypothetical protein